MPEKCQDCPLLNRVEALEKSNDQHGNTHREIFNRLNLIERDNAVQSTQYASIMDKLDAIDKKYDTFSARLENIERDNAAQRQVLDDLNARGKENRERLKELEAKPGKKWENATDKFSAGIIGGLSTLLAAGLVFMLAFASGLIHIGV